MTKFFLGLIVGLIVAMLLVWNIMPKMMLEVEQSKLSLDETVAQIEKAAIEKGWQVPKIYDLQGSLQKAGYDDMKQLKILSLCQPHHAYNILSVDENKKVSSMMPCRIGVFEDSDGNVMISRMNIGLMSKMFGGSIEEVMGAVAIEENEMLEGIIQH